MTDCAEVNAEIKIKNDVLVYRDLAFLKEQNNPYTFFK